MHTILAMLVFAAAAFAADDDDLASALESRYRRAVEAAEKVTVAVYVDREEEKPAPRRRGLPAQTGGVFARRPKDRPSSGTIIDPSGLILTTAFNVTGGKVNSIHVLLPDGTKKEAKVVGFDELHDVALLRVEGVKDLPVIGGSDLDRMKVGMPVVAAGRAPDGKGITVNPGIMSAPARDGGRSIQIDCRLNYGNVGGPLLDMKGNLVGVTIKVSTANAATLGQNSGVSFAIPYDNISRVLPDLKDGVRIQRSQAAFLGIQGEDWRDGDGVHILSVLGGTAAEAAGLQAGDVIIEFDGTKVETMGMLRLTIEGHKVGDKVKVKFLRNAEEMELEGELGKRTG
ncbi:MAG: S1C family serine protease [Planctomycetota bacterium]|jgi:S1-C subfamily serine protease